MALRLVASFVFRQSRQITRRTAQRTAQLSSSCCLRKAEVTTIPTDLEQSTGLERKELEAILKGNPDPFNLNVTRGSRGTKESPTLVPSLYEERIIGCVCEEESTSITWMVLKKGQTQRCPKCGNCFHLVTGHSDVLADD